MKVYSKFSATIQDISYFINFLILANTYIKTSGQALISTLKNIMYMNIGWRLYWQRY